MPDHVQLAGGADTRVFYGTEILLQCAKATSSSHCRRPTSINQGCDYRVERASPADWTRPSTHTVLARCQVAWYQLPPIPKATRITSTAVPTANRP